MVRTGDDLVRYTFAVSKIILQLWKPAFGLAVLSAFSLSSSVMAQAQEEGSRQIVLEEFTRARPAGPAAKLQTQGSRASAKRANSKVAAKETNLARYRRVTHPLASGPNTARLPNTELGMTIWRLRPSRPEDEQGARVLVMQEAQRTHWTPERIEADSPLKVGERVRVSVESPRAGYLYVVDREQYADGSLGDAYLIFPTRRTRGGDNKVRPGKLIDIPAQEDDPNYFTLVPSPNRNDQIGEVLTLLVTPQPLPLEINDKPLMIPASQLQAWEKLWGAAFERYEMEGGAGGAWTKAEKEAARVNTSRYLTQQEPTPQTIYRLAATGKGPLLVTVHLSYRNR
jgi:hypothetical protein